MMQSLDPWTPARSGPDYPSAVAQLLYEGTKIPGSAFFPISSDLVYGNSNFFLV